MGRAGLAGSRSSHCVLFTLSSSPISSPCWSFPPTDRGLSPPLPFPLQERRVWLTQGPESLAAPEIQLSGLSLQIYCTFTRFTFHLFLRANCSIVTDGSFRHRVLPGPLLSWTTCVLLAVCAWNNLLLVQPLSVRIFHSFKLLLFQTA